MLPTIKFRNLLSLVCLTLVVTFSAPELASAPAPEETWSLPQQHAEPSELASAPAPGETFRDCPNCPEMVVIPAGSFMMGSSRNKDESPRHRVRIDYQLAVGVYEVTFADWEQCVVAGGCHYQPDDSGWGRGKKRSVINISWSDTQQYVQWLSATTGKDYRLLSESEWEYVARAGSTTKYYWGNSPSGRHANATEIYDWPSDGYKFAAPVGSFIPNQC